MHKTCSFRSFFQGGFECSSHQLRSGKRLDLIHSTKHDLFASEDYLRLRQFGIRTARDGIRWHRIESVPGRFDFSIELPLVRAARETGTQIIWDVFHYGWPGHIDILDKEFIHRFAALARAFASFLATEQDDPPYLSLINEISFFSWAAGSVGIFNPFQTGRGDEIKQQLVRATIEAVEAVRLVSPDARFVQVDPIIHIITDPSIHSAGDIVAAHAHCDAQFDAWDMIAGTKNPELGGAERYLDIIGVNYYVHNQWFYNSKFVERSHPRYRPLRRLLAQVFERYRRPMFIAETGIEDAERPSWLAYVCDEAAAAIEDGVPLEGICLYPIVNHPGWDDDRHCHNGLWDYPDESGGREIFDPLAQEVMRQSERFDQLLAGRSEYSKVRQETGRSYAIE